MHARAKQFTYALLDERVPPASPMDREQALAELASRYFGSRGPDRSALFAPGAAPRPARGVDVRSSHGLVIDARIRGTWHRLAQGTDVDIAPVQPLTETQRRAVARAVARYRSFFE